MAQEVKIVVKAKDDASKKFKKIGDNAKKLGKTVAAGGAIAAVGIAAIGIKSINVAREQIRVEKQLAAVLKSTGGASGLTANEIKKMASELQKVSNFGDEAIISGQNILLTFTNLGEEVFPLATQAMLDISAAMGQDLKSSAILVGKALNDPILGLSALTRVGITFTDAQKDMIKSLAESGDAMGAQKLILQELNKQFAGSATAQADPLIQFKNALGDIGEQIGMFLIPSLNNLAQNATTAMPAAMAIFGSALNDIRGFLEDNKDEVDRLRTAADTAFGAMKDSLSVLAAAWKDDFGGMQTSANLLIKALAQVADLIVFIDENFEKIQPAIGIISRGVGPFGVIEAGRDIREGFSSLFAPPITPQIYRTETIGGVGFQNMSASVNVNIFGNASEAEVRSGVALGMGDIIGGGGTTFVDDIRDATATGGI